MHRFRERDLNRYQPASCESAGFWAHAPLGAAETAAEDGVNSLPVRTAELAKRPTREEKCMAMGTGGLKDRMHLFCQHRIFDIYIYGFAQVAQWKEG